MTCEPLKCDNCGSLMCGLEHSCPPQDVDSKIEASMVHRSNPNRDGSTIFLATPQTDDEIFAARADSPQGAIPSPRSQQALVRARMEADNPCEGCGSVGDKHLNWCMKTIKERRAKDPRPAAAEKLVPLFEYEHAEAFVADMEERQLKREASESDQALWDKAEKATRGLIADWLRKQSESFHPRSPQRDLLHALADQIENPGNA